eukprot:13018680-Alexandrium_andersonii.AAC.1
MPLLVPQARGGELLGWVYDVRSHRQFSSRKVVAAPKDILSKVIRVFKTRLHPEGVLKSAADKSSATERLRLE